MALPRPIPFTDPSQDEWAQQQPQMAEVRLPSAVPDMPAPQMPVVSKIPTPLEKNLGTDESRLQKIQWNQDHPWGTPENHPGKLGKFAHVLSEIGNVAGNIVAPNIMANIPQTQLGMKANEAQLSNRVRGEENEESLENERGATQAHTEAETKEMPSNAATRRHLEEAQAEEAENKAAQSKEPSLAQAYSHAVNQAIAQGRDPSTDPIVQHLSDAITSLQKQPAEKNLQQVTTMGPDHKPHTYGVDTSGNKVVDYGEHYERPITVNTGMAETDRVSARLAKPFEKGISDANSQLEKIADAKAMVNGSAESQALGLPKVLTALVSGQGSGVRITQAELNSIAKARGLSGDIEGTLNKWSGKGQLTAVQKQQLTGILDDVARRIQQKAAIHNQALDSINGATSRDQAIAAEKQARQQLSDMEKAGFKETREYQGHTYEKGDDGQWHLKQKAQ